MNAYAQAGLSQELEADNILEEIRQDPWLLGALATGTLLSAGFFMLHACCFGAEAAMLKSLSVICTTAG
ncbi:hypothetical protein DYI23_00265 [Roseibium polysiphoniae]|uniref:Uncharacterized protein n=1 Tax=Roseibium polysiphoniae TaxID=2571221 RepID=A0A944GRL5_9HYPH|nr:hypothetical protein [Roseibium polysiphoniae]MBS8258636.1 hypothetical protein [Roseibium polysiphoniae]